MEITVIEIMVYVISARIVSMDLDASIVVLKIVLVIVTR
jgi:hypothetical protein